MQEVVHVEEQAQPEVVAEEVVSNKKPTLKRNSLGQFLRKLGRVVVPHGQTYNVGRNKAKAALAQAKQETKRANRAAKRLAKAQ